MDLLHTAHVPPGPGPFPTVVALHGWGASAHDLFGLAPYFRGGSAMVVCPEGPLAFEAGPGAVGHGWFPITGGGPPDAASFEEAVEGLGVFLDAWIQTHPVDPERLVLLGFSQGGVMAYALALRDPSRYAALVALSSWLPAELAARLPARPEEAALPVFVSHGVEDPMIPISRGQESRDRLVELGYSPVYREYAMQHEIRPECLRDLLEFLDAEAFAGADRS